MDSYQHTQVALQNKILTLTLNRPERLNAWTPQMAREVHDIILKAGRDPDCRCIVITGAGRGFCAGADMSGLQDSAASGSSENAARNFESGFEDAPGPSIDGQFPGRFGYFYQCPKPIVVAINGACAGIGMIMTLYADLRYISEDAKLTTAFAARGLVAEHGIAWLLPRLIGEAKALDLLLTSRKFTGAEAKALGLVNDALPGDELMRKVMSVANTLANDVSPRSVAVMKKQVRKSYLQSFAESLADADEQMQQSFSEFDFKEGVNSFVERRAPQFKSL